MTPPIATDAAAAPAVVAKPAAGAATSYSSAQVGTSVATTPAELEAALKRVHANRQAWFDLPPSEKLNILRRLLPKLHAEIEPFAQACATATRHMTPENENYVLGYVMGPASTGGAIHKYIAIYETLVATGALPKPLAVEKTSDGRTLVTVGPNGMMEAVTSGPGTKLMLEIPAGKSFAQATKLTDNFKPCLTGILGAGNFETPTDILHQLFVENHVCVYKANPVNDSAATSIERIFSELIERNFLAVFRGGIEIGSAVTSHPLVEELMLTGSDKTANAIIWGVGDEALKNRAAKTPKCSKPFCSELGNCSPWVVAPCVYTEAELDHQAAHLALAKSINSGHVCVSPQNVVVDVNWPQRQRFFELVESHLARMQLQPVYYPGCAKNRDAFEQQYKSKSKRIQSRDGANEYVLVVRNVVATAPDADFTLRTEAFSPVLVELIVDFAGADVNADRFLSAVPAFVNQRMWGTLAATVVAPTDSRVDAKVVEKTLGEMRYGCVTLNMWSMAAMMPTMVWGGYAGSGSIEDIQSGMGFMHNVLQIENVSKGVVTTPLVAQSHMMPHHVNPKLKVVMPRLAYFMVNPSYWNLGKLLFGAVLGL